MGSGAFDSDVDAQYEGLAYLQQAGCPAYVHIESSRRKKLDPTKAWKGVFVGYAVDSHVYLV